MTQTCFKHFRCRKLSAEQRVLEADYTIQCFPDGDAEHAGEWWALAVTSWVGLAVLSVGFPLMMAAVMWRRMKRENEMVRKKEKSSVIAQRDFGRDFSFIAGEYRPEAYYAEPVDLLRKLMLTGAIGLVSPGTVLQSFCSVTISLFFLALHVWMW